MRSPATAARQRAVRPVSETSDLRRALRCSTTEAVFATVHVSLTQGIFLTNYVIDMGGSNMICGLVEALPFLTQAAFFVSPALVRRLNRRKPVVVLFSIAHRAAWLALIALLFAPWSPGARRTLMVLTLLLANACAVIAGNAWLGWMADLVPTSIRGAYYGLRNVYLGLTSLVVLFIGSQVLNATGAWPGRRWGYTACFGAAVISAFVAAFYLSRQYEPPPLPIEPLSWRRIWREPLRNRPFKRFLVFMVVWQFFLGLAAAFFGVHMVRVLHMTPAQMGYQAILNSSMALLTTRIWSRPLDRLGTKAVLLAAGGAVSLHVWLWFGARPGFLWPVWITVIVGGFAWSGFNLAVFNWPQIMTSPRQRPYALGLLGTASGITFVIGSLLGGLLTTVLPQTLLRIGSFEFLHYHLLFALSAGGRLCAVLFLATRVPEIGPRGKDPAGALIARTLHLMLPDRAAARRGGHDRRRATYHPGSRTSRPPSAGPPPAS